MNHEEEKGRAAVERICRKGGFKPGMKERVAGDGKLILIRMTVSGINNL